MVPNDVDLVRAWCSGDGVAAERLIRRHMRWMTNYFRRRLADEADDLVQQTLLACIQNIDRYDHNASFRGFLSGIARHQLLGRLRQRSRYRNRLARYAIVMEIADVFAGSGDISPEHRLELATAIQEVVPSYRRPLQLYYWWGYSVQELADELNLSEGAVKTRLRRGRLMLQRVLIRRRRKSGSC